MNHPFDIFEGESVEPKKGQRVFIALPDLSNDDIVAIGLEAFTRSELFEDDADLVEMVRHIIERTGTGSEVRLRLWAPKPDLLANAELLAECLRTVYGEIYKERSKIAATLISQETLS